jgi:uncharacterized protein YdcH (DUF465 family)
MCKIHYPVGSLTVVKQQLARNKIDTFHSINELLAFQNSYDSTRQQIISKHTNQLTEERNKLSDEISRLENEITTERQEIEQKLKSELIGLQQEYDEIPGIKKNYIQEFTYSYKALFLLIKIKYKELFFQSQVTRLLKPKVKVLANCKARIQYIISNFDEAVKRESDIALTDLDHKKKVIDEIKSHIYGAIGEQKVAKALEQLSDDYILINDFNYYFERSIPYQQSKQYIRTIQADHLLISPAGIFLIETKNWSKDSLDNLSLRSPVEQIKRTNYALYKLLSSALAQLKLDRNQWGDRKIPIRNLIVMINNKPIEEFEYVKILTLNELLGYIESFKASLSVNDTQKIANYILQIGSPNFDNFQSSI